MISHITGTVVEQNEKNVVIDVGGIGYSIFTNAIFELGISVTLYTNLIIREDAHELYGFATQEEKVLFNLLISVSGVGPKSALGILSLYPPQSIAAFVAGNDAKSLSLAPGIGKKTAEKIVVELRDKLPKFELGTVVQSDIVDALLSLGYRDMQIRAVITSIDGALPLEAQIKTALQLLQKQ
jgi:Holliday junction DNA helicase RuvA